MNTQRYSQSRKVYVDLYSASSYLPFMRSDMDHTVLPANYTMPAFIYTVNVIISRKLCKIETSLLQTTKKKSDITANEHLQFR